MHDDIVLVLILVGLSTASLSRLLAVERGPLGLIEKLRNSFPPTSEIGKAIRCPICNGVYISLILTIYAVLCMTLFAAGIWLLVIPAALGISYALVGLSNLWNN